MVEPAELASARSFLRIARLLSLILTLLALLLVVLEIVFAVIAAIALGPLVVGGYATAAVYFLLTAAVCFLIHARIPQIESDLTARQYQTAREALLIWSVLGLIFGFVLLGALLLVAFFKLETVINWARMGAPAVGAPGTMAQPSTWTAAAPSTAPPPPASSSSVRCPRCGNLGTWVAQYNRYYCYSCQQYI